MDRGEVDLERASKAPWERGGAAYGSGAMQQAKVARDVSPVQGSLNELRAVTENLEKQTELMFDRLHPVMNLPPAPAPQRGMTETGGISGANVAEQLQQLIRRVQTVAGAIETMRAHLEI